MTTDRLNVDVSHITTDNDGEVSENDWQMLLL